MKKRILHVIPSVNPALGGTVEALMQMVRVSFESEQIHEILSLDDSNRITSPDDRITIHAVGPTKRFYGYTPRIDEWLDLHLKAYNCAIIHGCWQYHSLAVFKACKKQGIPYFQYTHGMLDPWFKRTYHLKHLKKWLYWPWAEYRVLKHASRVIFTCEEEKRLAAQSFWLYRVNPEVIPLGIRVPDLDTNNCKSRFFDKHPSLKGKRLMTFMSRIHEKKGIDLLLNAVIEIQKNSRCSDADYILVIAGPCKDPVYEKQLKSISDRLPSNGIFETVYWTGMVQDEEKWGLLAASEAFVLPSHQENFGMVVAESLSIGTPVLITDKVNIWREVESVKAAMVASDTQSEIIKLIEKWTSTSDTDKLQYRQNALLCFERFFRMENNAAQLFSLIEKTCSTSIPL